MSNSEINKGSGRNQDRFTMTRRDLTGGAFLGMGGALLGLAASATALGATPSASHSDPVSNGDASDYRLRAMQSGIEPYHPLEEDGWTIVSGSPVQSVRMDHGSFEAGPLIGIWACTVGIIEMAEMPYHEFFTVFRGKVVATLNGAAPVELNPGDTFYVPKGARIRWDVREDVGKYLLIAGTGPIVA